MINAWINHIWQSTAFAAAAGSLALACRKNRAHVRYSLWLSASIKFLIPFSLLVSLGTHIPAAEKMPLVISAPAASYTVIQIAEPFLDPGPAIAPAHHRDWMPWAVLIIWSCGFAAISSIRLRGWRRVRNALRASVRMDIPAPIEIRSSPGLLEPGVVGGFRPVVLLPAGIQARLTPPQLEAVLAHEFCHARRGDNLTAALHMMVEAIFWFHPLVWWIGARLIEERERACDEAVLALGSEPREYAEGILNICKSYVESPLACVSGVTGSDLKDRIHAILSPDLVRDLNLPKKLILAVAGVAALAAPVVVGMIHLPAAHAQPAGSGTLNFEVASVKPNKSNDPPISNFPLGPGDVYVRNGGLFSASGYPLITYIAFAYKLIGNQAQFVIPQLPGWATAERFDIQARAAGDPGKDQMRLMMRSLLAERFKLAIRYEDREVPVFAFVLAKSEKTGPQLRPHLDTTPCPTERASMSTPDVDHGFPLFCNGIYPLPPSTPGRIRLGARNVTIGFIADSLSAGANVGRPIIDQTGLTGRFDFNLEWIPDRESLPPGVELPPDSSGPSFAEALQEQMGIRMQPQKHTMNVLVIDHVEHPSAN